MEVSVGKGMEEGMEVSGVERVRVWRRRGWRCQVLSG